MNSKFLNLNEEKQKTILNAAIKEFALQGYDKASTDVISNNAGISKGSLFNYFNNKMNLYLSVLEYAVKMINEEVFGEIDQIKDNDFYDRLKKISIIKHKNFIKYPLETQIITNFFIKPPKNIKGAERLKKYYEVDYNFLENHLIRYLDEDRLRPGITKADVLFMTSIIFEAVLKRHIESGNINLNDNLVGSDKRLSDFDMYIEVLKYGIYKN